ncbi:membrane fusion protein, multidrug efflux system [Arboricoccus pini]|uniref:Membrane fusion protein, multidrug efflux system n=1 Tax=Arboricoccus pini TaxID=1963835 RepID=A0A212R3R9_9PROT|nr:HlyD family secretion protein [Arboricoccus pini]SNB66468.1 membrane fusion protein, multidrug efflux system [Arboricoccus pini]
MDLDPAPSEADAKKRPAAQALPAAEKGSDAAREEARPAPPGPAANARPDQPEGVGGDLGQKQGPDQPQKPRRKRAFLIFFLVLLVLAIGGGIYWWLNRGYESTDDAFIDGHRATIAPRVGGLVIRRLIDDNQFVKQGDLLIEIDPRDYEAARARAQADLASAVAAQAQAQANLDLARIQLPAQLQQADANVGSARAQADQSKANLASAQAELARAQADATRYTQLNREQFASRQTFDQANATAKTSAASVQSAQAQIEVTEAQIGSAIAQRAAADTVAQQLAAKAAALRSADAQVAQAKASLQTAELNLSYTKIYAPADGWITQRSVEEGDVVQANQALTSFVFGTPWVTANFKETQLAGMQPGDPVDIVVDAYGGAVFKGRVDSIQRGTGSVFTLLPPENATGNYVKIVQRMPVKIVFDEPPDRKYSLGLGMSVVPTVHVGAGTPPGQAGGEAGTHPDTKPAAGTSN